MVFMKSMKPQLEAKGHKFPRGLTDVIPVCSPLWNVRNLCCLYVILLTLILMKAKLN
jgi:hypothetical protein